MINSGVDLEGTTGYAPSNIGKACYASQHLIHLIYQDTSNGCISSHFKSLLGASDHGPPTRSLPSSEYLLGTQILI